MEEAGLGQVSKSTASRICRELRVRYKAFCARSLADIELLVLFVDAIYLPTRPSGEKEGVLVPWGYTTQGLKSVTPLRVGLLLVPLRDQARQRQLAGLAVRRRLTVVQVRRLVETALALPPPPMSSAPLPPDDEPSGGGLSLTRQEALEALRTQPYRPITFGQLAALAESACCACGLASAPTICAECPNLHLLHAVLRQEPRCAA